MREIESLKPTSAKAPVSEGIERAFTLDQEYSELGGEIRFISSHAVNLSKDLLAGGDTAVLVKRVALSKLRGKIFGYTARRELLGKERTIVVHSSTLTKK
jgi:hypothetical protein